jgi:hypothetical protein
MARRRYKPDRRRRTNLARFHRLLEELVYDRLCYEDHLWLYHELKKEIGR